MITPYYQQELQNLKELAVEFAKAHPALAPLLSGPSTDPDVERLLEGSAFLTGLVREKLDDEFPEIVHNLLELVFPHYLRPIPSTAIIQFTPKTGLKEILSVKAGTTVASVPVKGTKCLFTTSLDVDLQPLEITSASLQRTPGQPPAARIGFELHGMRLKDWNPQRLRMLIGGSFAQAADRFHLLMRFTSAIHILPQEGGSPVTLNKRNLRPVGFGGGEALLPYPSQAFSGYRILQEYFILPHKFLFFDVTGLDQWTTRGDGTRFEVVFELGKIPDDVPEFKREHFILSATPAVNLFPHGAEPILLDHRQQEYRIRPSDQQAQNYQVYSVSTVTGFAAGTVKQKKYVPFEMFLPASSETSSYHVIRKISAMDETVEQYLTIAYDMEGAPPEPETLSLELVCSNFRLPENLQIGDISQPTESSPTLCEFKNISRTTAAVQPPIGKDLLWRLLSHVSLNYLPIADAKNLKALLRLYIFPDTRDRASVVANSKRVDGIQDFSSTIADRIIYGYVIRGQDLKLTVNSQNFASLGDMYLFGSVLDAFFSGYCTLNTFTRLEMLDMLTGEVYQWPIRSGDRPLL